MEEFISESAIMLEFDHPNVLQLLGVCFDTEDHLPLIVLPLMSNGDLKSFLIKKRGDDDVNVLPQVSHFITNFIQNHYYSISRILIPHLLIHVWDIARYLAKIVTGKSSNFPIFIFLYKQVHSPLVNAITLLLTMLTAKVPTAESLRKRSSQQKNAITTL